MFSIRGDKCLSRDHKVHAHKVFRILYAGHVPGTSVAQNKNCNSKKLARGRCDGAFIVMHSTQKFRHFRTHWQAVLQNTNSQLKLRNKVCNSESFARERFDAAFIPIHCTQSKTDSQQEPCCEAFSESDRISTPICIH